MWITSQERFSLIQRVHEQSRTGSSQATVRVRGTARYVLYMHKLSTIINDVNLRK